jgi:hypothetical protein
MAARLQRDIESSAPGFGAGALERDDLGVIAAGKPVVTTADDLTLTN